MAASGGFYDFGSAVTLNAGQQYYFFEDQLIPSGTIGVGALYSGGAGYGSFAPTDFYRYGFQALNFDVTGRRVAVGAATTPEPSSITLLATGLLGVAGYSLRKRQQA